MTNGFEGQTWMCHILYMGGVIPFALTCNGGKWTGDDGEEYQPLEQLYQLERAELP